MPPFLGPLPYASPPMIPFTLSGMQKGLLGFPVGSAVKNLPASVEDMRSIPGEGNGTHSSIFAWEIPWTEEPNRVG